MKKFLSRNLIGKKTMQWNTQNTERKKKKEYSQTKYYICQKCPSESGGGVDFPDTGQGRSALDRMYRHASCSDDAWLQCQQLSRPQERQAWATEWDPVPNKSSRPWEHAPFKSSTLEHKQVDLCGVMGSKSCYRRRPWLKNKQNKNKKKRRKLKGVLEFKQG